MRKQSSRGKSRNSGPVYDSSMQLRAVTAGQAKIDGQQHFIALYNTGQNEEALIVARKMARNHPQAPFAWKALGASLMTSGHLEEAEQAFQKALLLTKTDPEIYSNLGLLLARMHRDDEGANHMRRALEIKPDCAPALRWLEQFLSDRREFLKVLALLDSALALQEENDEFLRMKGTALIQDGQFEAGLQVLEKLIARKPDNTTVLHNIAHACTNLARFDEAEAAIKRCLELAPGTARFYSAYLLAVHYNPTHSRETIFAAHLEWDSRFRPVNVVRAQAADKQPGRRLRVGMISAGFRIHPVGQMITSALQFLPQKDIEIFAYSMSSAVDPYTRVIQNRADHWQSVSRLSDQELDSLIRADEIDILMDLCGHTEGSRSVLMAMEPAPLQIKWVGGQINTTGITGIDYMLSDSVETPPGVDDLYVEKLIRLPDDYICYVPRGDTPDIGPVPAVANGHVTFGCFNNPTKVNPVIIEHWACLLHRVPNSLLFLKGSQYDSEEMVTRIRRQFHDYGIEAERLAFETRSLHVELLDSYNRVDIALDPWPYSGGLTTCEALLMGVPVITLPGPTFAGRHSATHLTNAGLPEMVVETWDDYIDKAAQLAGDLEALAVFRKTLRGQLQQSPVCDAHRFGRHLNIALRAIWQRYCEGKAPAALTFERTGKAWFAGEADPVSVTINELPNPRAKAASIQPEEFDWDLPRQIVVMDNGCTLFRDAGFDNLRATNAFAVVGFDPASVVSADSALDSDDNVQLFPHAQLGSGEPTTLNACLDPEFSSTLSPLPAEMLPDGLRPGATVLTKLPINTVALDSIEGLEQIDWLILDGCSDVIATLRHGESALENTLILQVKVFLQARYVAQVTISDLVDWATDHGFSLYRMNNPQYVYLGDAGAAGAANLEPTQLESVDLLFIPSAPRMSSLSPDQRRVLSFLLHAVFNIRDLAYHILGTLDHSCAEAYLRSLPTQRSAAPSGSVPEFIRPPGDSNGQGRTPADATPPPTQGLGQATETQVAAGERFLAQRSLTLGKIYP